MHFRALPLCAATGWLLLTVTIGCGSSGSGAGGGGTAPPPVTPAAAAPTLTSASPAFAPTATATAVTLTGTGFTAGSTVAFNGSSVAATYVNSATLTLNLPASSLQVPGSNSFTVTTPAPGGGTTAALPFTTYVALANNSMIYNPVTGLLYVSVPGSAGAPYGNSVVPVDPGTGALGTPIFVGSEPDRMAISTDGSVLWVGLDGAGAVRKVDLTTSTAAYQFNLAAGEPNSNGDVPPQPVALVSLPNTSDSVIVAANPNYYATPLAIYDSGIVRGSGTSIPATATVSALQASASTAEIYAGGQTALYDFNYGASGLTLKSSNTSQAYTSVVSEDDLQLAGDRLYSDAGQVFDAESGSPLGTFYASGSGSSAIVAAGPTFADVTLGKVFILDNPGGASTLGSYSAVQVFDPTTYTPVSSSTLPVTGVNAVLTAANPYPAKLTRWGSNGLAFRTPLGVFSLRSNLVQDLSAVDADLGIGVATSGSTATGATTTYTATITNSGPSAATSVSLTGTAPSTGVLLSVTPSTGFCSVTNGITCSLGSLASGMGATVTFVISQLAAGSSTLSLQVTASETDPNLANNTVTSTVTVAGNTFNPAPSLSSVSPSAIQSGMGATTITLSGSGFVSASTVLLGGVALPTSYTSSMQLTATVPEASVASLGWSTVSVSNPTSGGGVSNALPLSIYTVLNLQANHILYDPFSRKIMASVASTSNTVAGNSIAAITPETATIAAPVTIGSQPNALALTSDCEVLYTVLTGSSSIARYNMLTGTAGFAYPLPATVLNASSPLGRIAAQPGTEDTVALDLGPYVGLSLFDFDAGTQTAAERGSPTGATSGECPQFYTASDLLALDYKVGLDSYAVTGTGFSAGTVPFTSYLTAPGCFVVDGGLAFGDDGAVANPATTPATEVGVFPTNYAAANSQQMAPDTSLQRTFFLGNSGLSQSGSAPDGVIAFDDNTFLPSDLVLLNMPAIEGNTTYTATDLVRWGQDGLAALTSGGHLYLIRGPLVVPQLLDTNAAATLTASSATSLAHGAGNTLLTLTGSGFVPGVAVTWNGNYRTTKILDATHISVAIPASDLAAAGAGSLVAVNPGAPASPALEVTIY